MCVYVYKNGEDDTCKRDLQYNIIVGLFCSYVIIVGLFCSYVIIVGLV
jgi:hypothetical protein